MVSPTVSVSGIVSCYGARPDDLHEDPLQRFFEVEIHGSGNLLCTISPT